MRSFTPYTHYRNNLKWFFKSKISRFFCFIKLHNWKESTIEKGYWCIDCGIKFGYLTKKK